ncbi:hypothetical protein N7478_012609 [Penicillium angulare]|uniref:uncharacterized protein n=1 Tax=Penicillium angulare TaxID=116970 RepID=UPI0025417D6A|nr:uncharacterized protein N7478_012609 [Penicillium angulare]KAJ5259628.1 hypothetical protein N7478_012609 [Penicillium angulare]
MTEKRRRKTGCLTCRSRHVKCDERKPECERCEKANVECAGYAEKRQLKVRYPGQSTASTENENRGGEARERAPSQPLQVPQCVPLKTFEENLHLVPFPINSNQVHRPHSRARDLLGYNQYVSRTLSILFSPKALHFWKDFLCQAAWEQEWAFDTIVALGSMHRAALLLSQEGGNCREYGLDTKIAAIQTYIRALEGLSLDLRGRNSPTPLAVGVLVLMAYIECFLGNIPAAIRHIQVIQYYSFTMKADESYPVDDFVSPIESSIRDLELICRIVRPFPSPLEPISLSNAEKSTVNLPFSFFGSVAGSSSGILQQLLEFTCADLDLKHLVWCVYAAHYKTVSKEKVLAFLKALDNWRTNNLPALDNLEPEHLLPSHQNSSYQNLGKLEFPPPCYSNLPEDSCLPLALYTFYRARLLWALCLLGDPKGELELETYFHIYQFLRYTRTALISPNHSKFNRNPLCENLRIGFSPLLYLAGRCCPTASWLRWIIQELEGIKHEGVFQSKAFATTLDILLSLENKNICTWNPSFFGHKFVPPGSRIVALFVPGLDGRSYEAYFARPAETADDTKGDFIVSKVARWSDATAETSPVSQDYKALQQLFSREWLMQQPLVRKWVAWSYDSEFDFNKVIQDHITGNRLLLDTESI